jgi:hypothetical protein
MAEAVVLLNRIHVKKRASEHMSSLENEARLTTSLARGKQVSSVCGNNANKLAQWIDNIAVLVKIGIGIIHGPHRAP